MVSVELAGTDCLKLIVLLWFLSMWVFSLGCFLFLWYSVLKPRVGMGACEMAGEVKVFALQTR